MPPISPWLTVEATPCLLGRIDELEDHGERGFVRQAALGAVAHGGERALDPVRFSQVLPMLSREVAAARLDRWPGKALNCG